MVNPNGFTYSMFGLAIRSNVSIPGLNCRRRQFQFSFRQSSIGVPPPWTRNAERVKEDIFYTSSYLGLRGDPALRIWKVADGAYLHLIYIDGVQFWLDRRRKQRLGNLAARILHRRNIHIHSRASARTSLEFARRDMSSCECGNHRRERNCFRWIRWCGEVHNGRSVCSTRGHSVMSDDIVALSEVDGVIHVMPAYPYLSLWPESVAMLYGSPEALPRFTANWDKRFLANGTDGVKFEESAMRLGAVYVLGERSSDPAPYVEELSAQSALIALVANTYATNTLDSGMRAMEFEALGRLVSVVAIRKIYRK